MLSWFDWDQIKLLFYRRGLVGLQIERRENTEIKELPMDWNLFKPMRGFVLPTMICIGVGASAFCQSTNEPACLLASNSSPRQIASTEDDQTPDIAGTWQGQACYENQT